MAWRTVNERGVGFYADHTHCSAGAGRVPGEYLTYDMSVSSPGASVAVDTRARLVLDVPAGAEWEQTACTILSDSKSRGGCNKWLLTLDSCNCVVYAIIIQFMYELTWKTLPRGLVSMQAGSSCATCRHAWQRATCM